MTLVVLIPLMAAMVAACGGEDSEERLERLEDRAANLEARLSAIEASLAALDEKLDGIGEMIMEASELTGSVGLPERLHAIEQKLDIVGIPTPTPTLKPMAMGMPTSTPEAMMEGPRSRTISIIENYAATRFFPKNIVVLRDLPVRLYLTRLHREHVNHFTVDPFYNSSEVILPGEIGVIEFLPDQTGEFKIRNVGHDFEASLVVVDTEEERKEYLANRREQMYALIHRVDDFRIFPDTLVIQKGIPTTIHNIGIIAEHQVSFKPFHDPEDFNIRPKEITPIAFTLDQAGTFTIKHELHGFTGQLIVQGK